jgi:hypothetical protein
MTLESRATVRLLDDNTEERVQLKTAITAGLETLHFTSFPIASYLIIQRP